MNEDIMRETLKTAGAIIADYIRPRPKFEYPRDAERTLNRLIEILDNQKVAEAVYSAFDESADIPNQLGGPDQRSQEQVLPEG